MLSLVDELTQTTSLTGKWSGLLSPTFRTNTREGRRSEFLDNFMRVCIMRCGCSFAPNTREMIALNFHTSTRKRVCVMEYGIVDEFLQSIKRAHYELWLG